MRALCSITAASFALVNLACDKVSSVQLPDPAPDADLAFGALYDGERPETVGPIARRQAVYSGRYSLSAGGGLEARLYFLDSAEVAEAAQARCAELERGADRRLCEETVGACADDPVSCWRAVKSEDGCGDGLELGEQVPMIGYAPEGSRLEASAPSPAPAVTLCGPALAPGCDNRRPGYVVLEAGRFGCVAEVRQLGCAVVVDASGCGLPDLQVDLPTDGGAPSLVAAGCTMASPGAPPPGFSEPAELALECAGRSFELWPLEALLADAGCPRPGPPTFETNAPNLGDIQDARVLTLAGSERLVFAGSGFDDCANYGCALRGGSCNADCTNACDTRLLLEGCTRDSWARCVGTTQRDACLSRCRAYCDRPTDAACFGETDGLSVTLAAPDAPEQDRFRLDLDGDGTLAALGSPVLAPLGGPWLAALTRARLDVVEAGASDDLLRRGRFETGLDAAGIVTWQTDRLAWFGTLGADAQVRTAALTRGDPATLTEDPPITLAGFAGADAGALGGRRGDYLVLARTAPRLSSAPRDTLRVVALGTGAELPSVELPGAPTALVGLAQGLVLVAYVTPAGRAGLALLEPGTDRFAEVHPVGLPAGLTVRALAPEPASCDGELPSACRVLLGLEVEGGSSPALLGAVEVDAGAPERLRWQVALRTLATQTVSLLVVDPAGPRAWAIAGERNQMTPLTLEP